MSTMIGGHAAIVTSPGTAVPLARSTRNELPAPGALTESRYQLFEVTGLELEYAVVDRALVPRCLVEDAFRVMAGHSVSDVDLDEVGFSNELAAHVFEMKTLEPTADLEAAEAALVDGMRQFLAVLRERFDARLLPTGMHPWMQPGETSLWKRSGRAIYETYDRIFGVQEHGWLNVQSCQTNLPFGRDEGETALLHNAIALVLPYLPALAASSPFVEGRPGAAICNRMAFYATNQRRIPEITGRVIPEYMASFGQYDRDVMQRIYKALDGVEGTERIRHEFVNSRGAIPRYDRKAIEIRVVDLQECVKMDVAIAVFARLATKRLVELMHAGALRLPMHDLLVEDFDACVAHGTNASVNATHLAAATGYRPGAATAKTALLELLDLAHGASAPADQPYLTLVEARIRGGNLAERILREVASERRSENETRAALVSVYTDLADRLEKNEPWAS